MGKQTVSRKATRRRTMAGEPAANRQADSRETNGRAVQVRKASAAVIALTTRFTLFALGGCQSNQPKEANFSNASDMAKLATFECAYRNVALKFS